MRIGNGYDIHKLVKGRPLILGGLHIPFELGLEGHSDADVLAHAVVDALLGAANLGDIGTWFAVNDPKWQNAESRQFVKTVLLALTERNYKILNVDSIIICEQPKLTGFIPKMKENLADDLQISINDISIKATTSEGLGHIGRGEAIAAQAVVLIDRII